VISPVVLSMVAVDTSWFFTSFMNVE